MFVGTLSDVAAQMIFRGLQPWFELIFGSRDFDRYFVILLFRCNRLQDDFWSQ